MIMARSTRRVGEVDPITGGDPKINQPGQPDPLGQLPADPDEVR